MYRIFLVCLDCEYKWQPAQDDYRKKIVYNSERNQKIIDLALRFIRSKQQTMIYVLEMRHVEAISLLLASELKRAGLDPSLASQVHGQLDDDYNERQRQALISGKLLCAICTSIWGEGTDVPPLRWVIYAAAGSASAQKGGIVYEQLIGRLGRIAPGKFRAGFIDFKDSFDKKFAAKSKSRKRYLDQKNFQTVSLNEGRALNGRRRFLAEKK